MTRHLLLAITILAFGSFTAEPATAQFGQGNSSNNLFQQYDVGGVGMYPAPYYSPQLGAQSYFTYQPLMPHEMMYQHSRNYYNYYNTGGYYGGNNALNKTSVRWQSGTNHMGPLPFSTGLESLRYKFNKRLYCIEDGSGRCGGGGIGGGHFGGGIRGGHGHRRGHHGAGLRRGGCSSGDCDTSELISQEYGEPIIGDGECSGGGCASRIGGLLHR